MKWGMALKVTAAPREDGRTLLEIEVEPERVAQAVQATYRRLVKKVSVPGFRPGKAPLPVLDRHLGRGYIERQALEELVPRAYREAVAQAGIEPVGRPELSVKEYRQGEPLRVEAVVTVRPEAEIGDLTDIRLDPVEVEVEPAEVEEALARLRRQYSTLVAVEGPVQPGDRVLLEWQPPGEAGAEGPDARPTSREVDVPGAPGVSEPARPEGDLPASLVRGLVGAMLGETREAEGHRVTVREIKRPDLPELNDDFARQVGGFSSLQEMRQQVENSLRGSKMDRIRRERETQITDELLRRCRVDVPEPLVEEELEGLLGRYRHAAGGTLPAEAEADLRVELRPLAERSARVDIILETIARREGLLATEQEMEPLLRKVLREGETLPQARARLEEMGVWRDLELSMARGKALRVLMERATRGESSGVPGADGGGADGQGGEGV